MRLGETRARLPASAGVNMNHLSQPSPAPRAATAEFEQLTTTAEHSTQTVVAQNTWSLSLPTQRDSGSRSVCRYLARSAHCSARILQVHANSADVIQRSLGHSDAAARAAVTAKFGSISIVELG